MLDTTGCDRSPLPEANDMDLCSSLRTLDSNSDVITLCLDVINSFPRSLGIAKTSS